MSCPHCQSKFISKRLRRTSLGCRIYFCNSCKRQFNERTGTPFNNLQFPTDIVLMAVLWRLRYKLGFRDVAELLLQRGFEISYESVRIWEFRFAPHFVSLVQVPGDPGCAPALGAQILADQWSEAELPGPNGLVADHEPAL